MSEQDGITGGLAGALMSVAAPGPARRRARPLDDVAATAALGRHIAARAPRMDVVVAWNDPGTVVIAYAIAVAAHARVVAVAQDEGIVELLGDVPRGASVLLASDEFRAPDELRALAGVVGRCGARTVAVAALWCTPVLRMAELRGAPVICVSDDARGA